MAIDTSKISKSKKVDIDSSMSIGTVLEKLGLKKGDLMSPNFEKLKSVLSDNDIKFLEKELKDMKGDISKKDKEIFLSKKTQDLGITKKKKANPGDAGGSIAKLAKGGFPDLSGDGKVTQKDILMGKGVIKMKKGGMVKSKSSKTRIAKRGFGIAKRGY